MARYEIVLTNDTGGGANESPISGDNRGKESKSRFTPENAEKALKTVVSYRAVKSLATSAINHEVSLVELRTGSNELQQRANFINQVAQQGLGILESTVAGFVATGGNPFGAVAGMIVGATTTMISYAQARHTAQLKQNLEDVSIRMNYIRAGAGGSRRQ